MTQHDESGAAISPGEPVAMKAISEKQRQFREECKVAFEAVKRCTSILDQANFALEMSANSAKLRRMQRNAASELSQAQFVLERALDRVPPDKDLE